MSIVLPPDRRRGVTSEEERVDSADGFLPESAFDEVWHRRKAPRDAENPANAFPSEISIEGDVLAADRRPAVRRTIADVEPSTAPLPAAPEPAALPPASVSAAAMSPARRSNWRPHATRAGLVLAGCILGLVFAFLVRTRPWATIDERATPAAPMVALPPAAVARAPEPRAPVTPPTIAPPLAPARPVLSVDRPAAVTRDGRVARAPSAPAPLPASATATPDAVENVPTLPSRLAAPVVEQRAELSSPAPIAAPPIPAPSVIARPPALAPPAVPAAEANARAVRQVLHAYEDSYDRLDAQAVASIWRGLDAGQLARAFSTLSSQDLTFERCDLNLVDAQATASCRGLLRYVPRVGAPSPRTQPMTWTIELSRLDERWLIERVTVR
jgi:hypothetical protein